MTLHTEAALLLAAAGFGFAPTGSAGAQSVQPTVRVGVTDSSRGPIGGADVQVLSATKTVVVHGTTSALGVANLSVPTGTASYSLVIRKIGYRFVQLPFATTGVDTLVVNVTLDRLGVLLQNVQVSATADPYSINAKEIAAFDRPLFSAWDVVRKMRPDMVHSHVPEVCDQPTNREPALSRVYVNGRRLPIDRPTIMTSRGIVVDGDSIRHQIAAILEEIAPEHIAEIHYVDCRNRSYDYRVTQNAIYVVLKVGVSYEVGRPSTFVVKRNAGKAPEPSSAAGLSRGRLIGVFDIDTGDPIEGVSISDETTGLSVTTTVTGTASLPTASRSSRALKIVKPGYRDTTIALPPSRADTTAITVLIRRRPADVPVSRTSAGSVYWATPLTSGAFIRR